MPIEDGNYKIYGFLDPDHTDTKKPLHVIDSIENEAVVVGDDGHLEVFVVKKHGPNQYSFRLITHESLYVGFKRDRLRLVSVETIWDVYLIEPAETHEGLEVYEVTINVNEKKIWEMGDTTPGSEITLLQHNPTFQHLAKHKWKFVRA